MTDLVDRVEYWNFMFESIILYLKPETILPEETGLC